LDGDIGVSSDNNKRREPDLAGAELLPDLGKTAQQGRVERVTTELVRGKAHLKRGRSGSVLGGGAGPVTRISLGALRGERVWALRL